MNIRVSRLEVAGLWICYCVAVAAIVRAGLPDVARALLFLVLTVLCANRATDALLYGRYSTRRIMLGADGRAVLHTRSGLLPARLKRVVYRSGWLTVLDFRLLSSRRVPAGRREARVRRLHCERRVIILPDSVDVTARRRLAVHLRCLPDLAI